MASFELKKMPQFSLFTNDHELDTSELYHLGHEEGAAKSLSIAGLLPLGVVRSPSLFPWLSLFFSPFLPVFFFLDNDTLISTINRFIIKVTKRE